MGINPKIGITGLPRSGKSAVMEKVVNMLDEEMRRDAMNRGLDLDSMTFIGGMRTKPLTENGERVGYKCMNIRTGEEGVIAHKNIDSRLRIMGYGIDTTALVEVGVPAIEFAKEECEIIVIDEIGKFAVESEEFVQAVRSALEEDKPTIMTLHKKSRHPLLQDIRRRDDSRILEVTPVNRALLPYKIHKLMHESF